MTARHSHNRGQASFTRGNVGQHWTAVTFLTVHFAFLNMEAAGANGLVTLHADEAVHVVRVLHRVNHLLLIWRRKNIVMRTTHCSLS